MIQFSKCHSEENKISVHNKVMDFFTATGEKPSDFGKHYASAEVMGQVECFGLRFDDCWIFQQYFDTHSKYWVLCESGKVFMIFAQYEYSEKHSEQYFYFYAIPTIGFVEIEHFNLPQVSEYPNPNGIGTILQIDDKRFPSTSLNFDVLEYAPCEKERTMLKKIVSDEFNTICELFDEWKVDAICINNMLPKDVSYSKNSRYVKLTADGKQHTFFINR
jgi:hypothetical protein